MVVNMFKTVGYTFQFCSTPLSYECVDIPSPLLLTFLDQPVLLESAEAKQCLTRRNTDPYEGARSSKLYF